MAVFTRFGLVFTPGLSFLTGLTRVTGFLIFFFLNILYILSKKWDFLYYQDIKEDISCKGNCKINQFIINYIDP